jgi:hypothetical protein
MKRPRLLFALLFAALFGVLAPNESFAQIEPPKVSASIQPRDVEVGEPFSVSLSVTVDSNAPSPSDPQLPLPNGLRSGPPSVSNQTQFSIVNGHISHTSGITATWQVVATREGAFAVGPPSVTWNGRKLQANGMRVVVHPASPGGQQRHAAPSPNPVDPFGMFPRLPGFFDAPEPEPQAELPPDPELALDAPIDANVFLRSVVDQKHPVVGEQVTLNVYLYTRSPVAPSDVHEPSSPDFFRRELLDPNAQPGERTVLISGVVWHAQIIFKVALFPLKSGELEIGPMQATFMGGRNNRLNPLVRASQRIIVSVSEPPAAGRPVGYQMGDVGNYTLTATVEPRKSEVGGAVAVTLKVAGVGNVPNAIKIPTSSALEWLDPQVREDIEIENGKVRGSRTFAYLARPKTAGTIELGEATLPYWNPDRKAYDIARAYLGKIEVLPDASKLVNKDPAAPHDPWASLGKERDRPGGYKRAAEPLTERPFYWLGLFGAPIAIVASSLGSRGVRRLRGRFAARRESAERGIDQALAEARGAVKVDNRVTALGPLERALYLAIERVTGLKARALLIDDVPAALEQRGIDAELAAEIKGVLGSVEVARFAPDGAASARELFERADAVVRRLSRMGPIAKG